MQPLVFHPINSITQNQVNDAQNTYNNDAQAVTNAQNNLSNYQKNMVSGTDMYSQELAKANANAGYDPNQLKGSYNQIQQIQGIMGGLPRSIQAQNANYGATAGDVAQQYGTTAANLNQSLNLANTTANNQLQSMQGGLTGAQQATTAGQQGQKMQLDALNNIMTAAQNQYATAQQQLDSLNKLWESQGQFNSDEARQYMDLNRQIAQSAATIRNLNAQAGLYAAQATGQNQQNAYAQAQAAQQQNQQRMAAQQQAAQRAQQAAAIRNYQSVNPLQQQMSGGLLSQIGAGLSSMFGGF